jgi:hypothetical protein
LTLYVTAGGKIEAFNNDELLKTGEEILEIKTQGKGQNNIRVRGEHSVNVDYICG